MKPEWLLNHEDVLLFFLELVCTVLTSPGSSQVSHSSLYSSNRWSLDAVPYFGQSSPWWLSNSENGSIWNKTKQIKRTPPKNVDVITCGADQRKDFLNSSNVKSENWFSPTAGRDETHWKCSTPVESMHWKVVRTCERVIPFVVSVNRSFVLGEYLQPLVEFLPAVHFSVLHMEKNELNSCSLHDNPTVRYCWRDSIQPTSDIHDLNCSSSAKKSEKRILKRGIEPGEQTNVTENESVESDAAATSSAWKRSGLPCVCRWKAQDDDSTANRKKRVDMMAADGPKRQKEETKVLTAWRFWRNTPQRRTNHNNGRINQSAASR